MEKNHTNYYGTPFTLLSDIMTHVNFPKWIIMNFVLELLIVIFVLPMSIVVGANLLWDVCPVTKNMLFVLLPVSTDGFMMLNHVLEKFMPVCSPTLPPKPPVLLLLKWLDPNNMSKPCYITKQLLLLPLFWEPKELNMKLPEQIHFLGLMFHMILMKHKYQLLDKSIKLKMSWPVTINSSILKLEPDLIFLNPILFTDGPNTTKPIPEEENTENIKNDQLFL